jgi:hypothetical protein
MEAGKHDLYPSWEALCANQDKRENERVPRELEPFFARIVEERERYQAEDRYRPERIEKRYPVWSEIAEALPVTGKRIREVLGIN